MKITNRRSYQNWSDVAFTALPLGWVNVFEREDGTHYITPCPGVLTQESVSEETFWTEEYDDGRLAHRDRTRDTDREVRTVFACGGFIGEPYLLPAADMGNYLVTTTPEQWAEWQRAETAETQATDDLLQATAGA